jgi:hypothetical protein
VFADAATAGLNNFSGAIGRWLQWLVVIGTQAEVVLVADHVSAQSIRLPSSGVRE